MFSEAEVVIAGQTLTTGEAMTIRVALGVFAAFLKEGLGDDATGIKLTEGYKMGAQRVLKIMHDNAKVANG